MRRALTILLALIGCATLGNEAAFPDPIQTSGAGPFRRLDMLESGVPGRPEGRALITEGATTGGMFVPGFLFYVTAAPLADPPDRDPSLAADAVDWAQFEGRRILRTASRAADLGHDAGTEVLSPAESWEGDAVFDPWVVVEDNGRSRLYYAAEGGIGIAESNAPDGTFSRMTGPIITDARSPTVVPDPAGGWLMYFESSTGIGVARSSDGVAFTVETEAIPLDAEPPADNPNDLSFHRPGALTTTTPTGRTVVRLYFEVVRDDDTRAIGFAASEDGITFERRPGAVYSDENPGAPMPFLDEEERTRLYLTVEDELRGTDLMARSIVMAVAPGFERYVELPEDDMME